VGVQRPTTRQDLCGRHLGRGFSLYGGAAAVGLSLCILSSSAVMSSHDSAIAENLPTFLDAVLYGHLVGGWVGGSRGTTPTLPALSHHTTPSHAVSDGRAGCERKSVKGHKFRRRTGTLMGVLEERYLRDDLACGGPACAACAAPTRALDPTTPAWPHLCIPAADALAKYVEVRAARRRGFGYIDQGAREDARC
jgi:hypothetical protein